MLTISARLALGFAAAALSHVIFQGALGAALYAGNLVPELVWSLEPVPPFGVPATVNNMFCDGLWGMLYALLGTSWIRLDRTSSGASSAQSSRASSAGHRDWPHSVR